MDRLIRGYLKFRTHVFPQKRRRMEQLADGQRPRYLFITCSDSRVVPREFTQTDAGDLFIERSIGNIVPRHGRGETEALAAIEYAVKALGVGHIIICGHSGCGAMKGLLDPERLRDMPDVAAWIENAGETRDAVKRKYGHLQGDDLLQATIRENVVVQLEHVRALPSVAARLGDGSLQVHGWVYQFEQGRVFAYDRPSGQFVPLAESPGSRRSKSV